MKVLMISRDKKIFDENSEVRQRMAEYGRLVNGLYIIVFTKRKSQITRNKSQINPKIQISNNTFVYPTNSRSRWFYIRDAVKIGKKIIRNLKLEIRNSRNKMLVSCQDPFECGLIGYRIAKKAKIPLQIQIHTDFLSPYFKKESLLSRIRVLLAKFLIPRADCIRVVSERIKKSIVSRFKLQVSRISVLPIFTDIEKIKNAPIKTDLHSKYPQFDFIILMASRFTREKNIGLAIQTLCDANIRIHTNDTNTGLIIVGDGPEEKNLKSQISNLKINENIIMENWTDDLPSYYKTADLFLFTSNYEGYGRTLVEAAAAGCKIISSDVGVANEILSKENIFNVGCKKDLTDKIIKAINGEIKMSNTECLTTKERYLQAYKKSWEACGS